MPHRPTLLLGASGLLGHHLAPLFPAALTPLRQQCDLAQPESLAAYLAAYQPGLILNAAAYTAVDQAESEPEKAMALNATAPAALAAYCAQNDARLLHVSTDYVFNGSGQIPWQESDPTAPLNAYGISKAAGEAAITQSGARYLILRTSWLYDATRPSFFTTMLKLAGRESLNIVHDSIGAPTFAPHLAAAVARLAVQELRHETNGFLHLTNQGETSWHGFASAIFQQALALGLVSVAPTLNPVAMKDYPSAAIRPANCRLSHAKAAAIGIALPGWQDGLARAIAQRAAENNAR